MALVNKWPDQISANFDNQQYIYDDQSWNIGAPITRGKLENLEKGIRILATQMNAIIAEIGSDGFETLTNNTSRIDRLSTELYGSANPDYENTTSRLDKNDNKIAAIASELDAIETHDASVDKAIAAIKNELGGTYVENTGFTNSNLDNVINKVSSIATNMWGTDTTSGDSRIDNVQLWITGNKSGTYSNNASVDNRLQALENEVQGEGGSYSDSQIDRNKNAIAALATRANDNDTLNTEQNGRLTTLENNRVTDAANINTNSENIATARADLNNIISELGGSYSTSTGFNNSHITTLQSDVQSIQTKNQEQDWALNAIKLELGGSFVSDVGFESSRIDNLEDGLTNTNSTVANHTSRISNHERRITTLEQSGGGGGGGSSATINMLRTINTEASDILVLAQDATFMNNSITFIFLNAATLGANDIKIKFDENEDEIYDVFVTENKPLRATFQQGSLLGIYLGSGTTAYMFNAPLAI